MLRFTSLFVGLGAIAAAQPITYGFKLGVPFQDASTTRNTQSRWTGGPFLEYHLPMRLSVEFGALFRTSREDRTFLFAAGSTQQFLSTTDKVKTLDLPLLLKYRFTKGKVRPFIGAGGAWSHRWSDFQGTSTCLGTQASCRPPEAPFDSVSTISRKSTLSKFGPAASAGIEVKTRYMTFSPEVRWLREYSGSATRNQFMVGVGFGFGR